jgi:predicted N-acetyltransferase YhbS
MIYPATEQDVIDIYHIQCTNYLDCNLWESCDFIQNVVSFGLSFVAIKDGTVIGYILCHNLTDIMNPPKLNSDVPKDGEHLFIHDTCVSRKYHHQGIASKLVDAVHQLAVNRKIYIIAVKESIQFWIKKGYVNTNINTVWNIEEHYKVGASYMCK